MVQQTFREAAIAMLQKAASTMMPGQFRRFFVYYLIGDEPSDALQLWEKCQHEMTECGCTNNEALYIIEQLLNSENRTSKDFGLPELTFFSKPVQNVDVERHLEKCNEIEEKFNANQCEPMRCI